VVAPVADPPQDEDSGSTLPVWPPCGGHVRLRSEAMSDPTVTVGIRLTAELLAQLAPRTDPALLAQRLPGLQRMLDLSDAVSPLRAAAVLARVVTETAGFRLVIEEPSDASGPHFERYAGRMGNRDLADAAAFCGCDFLQSTGREGAVADTKFAQGLGFDVDFVAAPGLRLDPRYLGLASARYIVEHPYLFAAADAGDIDGVSCIVNAGQTKDIWLVRHGDLLDGAEAAAANKANGWEQGNPKRRHGIYGLHETRAHYAVARPALGISD
jgi:predicted chitinase